MDPMFWMGVAIALMGINAVWINIRMNTLSNRTSDKFLQAMRHIGNNETRTIQSAERTGSYLSNRIKRVEDACGLERYEP